MGKNKKKSPKQDYSEDKSVNLITKKTTPKIEKSHGIREIFSDTSNLKKKHPWCFLTCGCFVAMLFVYFIISIAFIVNCDAKDNNCNANVTSFNNTPHHSNRAEYSKMQEYNKLYQEPFCQFPFPRGQVSYMKCFLPFKGEYTLKCVFHEGGEVKRICSLNETEYHFKFDCAETAKNCSPVCFENCTRYSITITTPSILLLEISDTCLEEDGHIGIWNADFFKMSSSFD